jgi:hypothetical protein
MDLNLADLFTVEPMHGGTVNGWIHIPSFFTITIYCAITGIMVVSAVFLVVRKTPLLQALRKSIVIAFFSAGFLYLVYSERTWYTWFGQDIETYSGYSTEAKIGIFNGPLYDFIKVAREVLKDDDYIVYSADDATRLMTQYYLLPRRNRANAKNVIVLYDNGVAYDDRTKTFTRDDTRKENAELLFRYDFGAYIVRIR